MFDRPSAAGSATVYTHELAGATLDELLEAADEDCWPNSQCEAEWALLRNWAIQTETLMVDEAEDLAWEESMRELAHRGLPYAEWVEARLAALKARTRARKLGQTRLRYAYGYKQPRPHRLVRREVRSLYRRWAGVAGAEISNEVTS